jgi:hypothetical protein
MKTIKPFARTLIFLFACMMLGWASPPAPPQASLPPSTATSNFVAFNLVNSTYKVVADLASKNLGSSDHQIRTKLKGRILVSAQVKISNPGGIAVRGGCHLLMSDGTGPTNGLTEISVRPATWFTTANAAYDLTVPILGYVVVECQQLAATGATTGQLDNMIVWEAAE